MSDYITDLVRGYEENVIFPSYPRSIGLFSIPEYPELEPKRGMWSLALDAILTTLRYLAPATLLTLFWGQQSFLFKLVKCIDTAFRSIVFSSEEQKKDVLKWLADAGPVRVEHLETVWRHGWIVCGVLDAALPGACAGHPPTRLSIKHAQTIADHYLGVEPIFSRQELESNDSLSKHQEWKLATYLDRIRESLSKLTPPVSKPGSQRTSPETTQFTLDYVARGSGLAAAHLNCKVFFKVFPTAQQSLDPGEITILIRGPKDTYGMTVLPPILGKAQTIRHKLLGLHTKPNYTENILPITQGVSYLRSYGKNDMTKIYHIPKTVYDIEIEAEPRSDHTRVSYIVSNEGKYHISITSRGQNIVGSPFTATASKNILGILEQESFSLEDGEEIDIVDVKTDRKVVLRIVDFVTEKMLLNENGSLEKISEEEAKTLMASDKISRDNEQEEHSALYDSLNDVPIIDKKVFYNMVKKVILINRVCKIFRSTNSPQKTKTKKEKCYIRSRSQQDIPDIVNSTFSDKTTSPYLLKDVRSKYIIPENITVSLVTEKTENINSQSVDCKNKSSERNIVKTDQGIKSDQYDENSSPSNPFLDNYNSERNICSYVSTEYETNNSQYEECPQAAIKIIVEENTTSANYSNNPFIDHDEIELERPKTPVYKIITGEVTNRGESVYVDPKAAEINEELLANEFVNPFFIHQHHQAEKHAELLPVTDFIIGAPVSLPPLMRASTPEPNMDSLVVTRNEDNTSQLINQSNIINNDFQDLSTSLHNNLKYASDYNQDNVNSTTTPTFHSLDSILTDSEETSSGNQCEVAINTNRNNISPRKDIWDSAYVSIDDNNSSPDSNNNDNIQLNEAVSKQKISLTDDTFEIKPEEFINMGPAERELWQTCNDLNTVYQPNEDIKPMKWEIKRPIFTPIIEESDRSISAAIKDLPSIDLAKPLLAESDHVTVAFTELDDMFYDYYPNSESDSTDLTNENNKLQSFEVNYTKDSTDCVDSASGLMTDVKRQTSEFEGKISEVQENVTESDSASQTLPTQDNIDIDININDGQVQFGDQNRSNIVLERKKYWDDRIKQIEAKSQETTTIQKKKKILSKHLRQNDSLTKRRGKQLVKNFLGTTDAIKKTTIANNSDSVIITNQKSFIPKESFPEQTKSDVKLVDQWKKYWDDKFESDNNVSNEVACTKAKSTKSIDNLSNSLQNINHGNLDQLKEECNELPSNFSSLPKQELPEEVYKAFETSPKRFFGTSRKQILSKIDTFLGKASTVDVSPTHVTGVSQDSGLVSSRISLFRSISDTREQQNYKHRSKSLHNIYGGKNIIYEHKEDKFKIDTDTSDHRGHNEVANEKFIQDKRLRISSKVFNQSFDETMYKKPQSPNEAVNKNAYVRNTITSFDKKSQHNIIPQRNMNKDLRRKSFSKSEMDIFNKAVNTDTGNVLDKYKSCDELPKINVKNFISLYESVSKTSVESLPRNKTRTISSGSQKHSSPIGGAKNQDSFIESNAAVNTYLREKESVSSHHKVTSVESINSMDSIKFENNLMNTEATTDDDKETTFLSLSDIELEIVENSPDTSSKVMPEQAVDNTEEDYKSRFKMAKEFFKSLEELRVINPPRKLNECEMLLKKKTTESPESRPQRRVKKNVKSHSMPSSEISKIWSQLQAQSVGEASASKLMKISEKFNVDDLFSDVTEGKLSRQGSLRGIPHKKAVLETFRSMENLTDKNLSPYDFAASQLSDFAKDNQIKNAQTYLAEYPYLPMTDPSKYHSRVDTKASGLISLKEIMNSKPRRNSVPDLRLNPTFTVNL